MKKNFKNEKLFFPAGEVDTHLIKNVGNEIREFVSVNENMGPFERHKPHLLLPAVYDLCENKTILNSVEKFLGKDAFLWYSVFFLKKKSSEQFIPWHYDDYFWSITGKNGCTAWIAIEDVDEEMGPMEFCFDPISNHSHQTETNENNMLARGNTSTFNPTADSIIQKVCLKKGQFSLHSNKVWHRSGTNKSNRDRIAVALRFVTSDAFPIKLKYIKRGAVGSNFDKKFFFSEERPTKIFKPLKKGSHLYSVLIALFISAFGDEKRNLSSQLVDSFKFIFSKKGYKTLFGGIKQIVKGEDSLSKKINDG